MDVVRGLSRRLRSQDWLVLIHDFLNIQSLNELTSEKSCDDAA